MEAKVHGSNKESWKTNLSANTGQAGALSRLNRATRLSPNKPMKHIRQASDTEQAGS
jgi:hypothetical protein